MYFAIIASKKLEELKIGVAKSSAHTKYFRNFVFGDHSDDFLYFFDSQDYKDTTNIANRNIRKLKINLGQLTVTQ